MSQELHVDGHGSAAQRERQDPRLGDHERDQDRVEGKPRVTETISFHLERHEPHRELDCEIDTKEGLTKLKQDVSIVDDIGCIIVGVESHVECVNANHSECAVLEPMFFLTLF